MEKKIGTENGHQGTIANDKGTEKARNRRGKIPRTKGNNHESGRIRHEQGKETTDENNREQGKAIANEGKQEGEQNQWEGETGEEQMRERKTRSNLLGNRDRTGRPINETRRIAVVFQRRTGNCLERNRDGW